MSKGFTYRRMSIINSDGKFSSVIFLPGTFCLHYGILLHICSNEIERERGRVTNIFPLVNNLGQTTSGQRF